MFITTTGATTQDVIDSLTKEPDFRIIQDSKRGLYIAFNEKKLYEEIDNFKQYYDGDPDEKAEDSNVTNKVAIAKLDDMKRVVGQIAALPVPEELFDCMTLTKAGKFPKNKNITLYLPDLKSTYSGEYFSQMELALQLSPIEIMPSGGFSFNWDRIDDVCVIEVNPRASFTNSKRPENIIDVDGTLHKAAPTVRNTYLKQDELKVGCSYTDAKGSEYLYLGIIDDAYTYSDMRDDGSTYGRTGYGQLKYAYLRVTKGIKKELLAADSLYDYLHKRFESKLLKDRFEWNGGLNNTESKKFVGLNTVYFDEEKSKLDDMAFDFAEGTYASDPHFKCSWELKFSK